jgi:hypothetical protein
LRIERLSVVPGGLRNLHVHRARRRVDPLGLVAVGIALPVGRALIKPRAEDRGIAFGSEGLTVCACA